MNPWKKSVLGSTIVGALLVAGIGTGPASAAPPERISGSFEAPCPGGDALIEFSGKSKTVTLPNGDVLGLSPGLRVTVSNQETKESVSYVATGALRFSTLEDGNIQVIGTGRNVVFRPNLPGIFLTKGRISFVVTPDNEEVVPFSGPGPVTDVCAEIGLD